ncbi:hypothetical protein PR202_gb01540 [Eleusine coracana subsp. coracana]|uniref:Uncharacterized protein n=1 Tax=Eleusine coracana subsp. coracana TaxID=191504 RepID=A0AAV5DWX4_ELECO|nr:hypothetical protein PR202_gb01540 [Eleusine coracana subsp. coracana]
MLPPAQVPEQLPGSRLRRRAVRRVPQPGAHVRVPACQLPCLNKDAAFLSFHDAGALLPGWN